MNGREADGKEGSGALLRQGIRGAGYLTAGSVVEYTLRFLRNLVLARLLDPEAFGLMATIWAAVAATEALAEVGLRQVVIRSAEGGGEEFINVVWWIGLVRGSCLYIIAFLVSPAIAQFFGVPQSANVLRVGFLIILVNGLLSPGMHVLEKEFQYHKWVLLNQSSALVGILVSLVLAYALRNVWALVIANLVEAFIKVTGSHLVHPIKIMGQLNRAHMKTIARFSKGVAGLPVLLMMIAHADTFVIGRILSVDTLGVYYFARDLADLLNKVYSRIHPLLLPTFTLVQDDKGALGDTMLKVGRLVCLVGLPFVGFCVVFAKPLLAVLYGDAYSQPALPFALLCVLSLVLMLTSILGHSYFAIGEPGVHRAAMLLRALVLLGCLYPFTKDFGLSGAAAAALLSGLCALWFDVGSACKRLFFTWDRYARSMLPGALLGGAIALSGLLLRAIIKTDNLVLLTTGFLLCTTVWVVCLKAMNIVSVKTLINEFRSRGVH